MTVKNASVEESRIARPQTVHCAPMATPLPTEVREQPTSKTNVYTQGELMYDGATGQPTAAGRAAAAAGAARGGKQRGPMNELLDWGIRNSDPEELRRRAEAGERRTLTPLDKEMLDMLLGQPTAAAMRACLVKLEPEALAATGGNEAALSALEELEFHCEDLDNANDLAKIGGVRALLDVGADAAADDEVREMALGVVAAGLQNNPPFQKACVALEAPEALLRLLAPAQPLTVRRKALYALSALLRCGGDEVAGVLAQGATLPALLAAAGSDDAKQQRRGLFLLLALLRETDTWAAAVSVGALAAHAQLLGGVLLGAACGGDVEARESAVQLLLLLRGCDGLQPLLAAAGAEAKLAAVRDGASEDELSQEGLGHFEQVQSWLRGEPWRPGLGVGRPA